jgi:hypothetical protein
MIPTSFEAVRKCTALNERMIRNIVPLNPGQG